MQVKSASSYNGGVVYSQFMLRSAFAFVLCFGGKFVNYVTKMEEA